MAYGKPIPSNQHAKFICTKCGKQWSVSSYATGGSLPKGTHAPLIPSPTKQSTSFSFFSFNSFSTSSTLS